MRAVEIFFEIEAVVAESVHGFGRSIAKSGIEFGVAIDQAHAPATATGDGLQKNGIAHALCQGLRLGGSFNGFVRPGNRGNIDAPSKLAAGSFRPERFHGFRGRPDEGETVVGASTRQGGVFREKSVAWMHGIATGGAGYVHELINAEITFARGRRANGEGFIAEADMQRLAINVNGCPWGGGPQFMPD